MLIEFGRNIKVPDFFYQRSGVRAIRDIQVCRVFFDNCLSWNKYQHHCQKIYIHSIILFKEIKIVCYQSSYFTNVCTTSISSVLTFS